MLVIIMVIMMMMLLLLDDGNYDGDYDDDAVVFLTRQGPCSNIQLLTKCPCSNIQLLTKFDRRTDKKNAQPPGGHVFQATGTIFKLVQDIIGINLLTMFHDDQKKKWLLEKNATPPWRPYIIGTNCHTKFHEDRKINVASRVLTRKNAPPPDIIGINLLTKFHENRTINVASRPYEEQEHRLAGVYSVGGVGVGVVVIYIIVTNLLTKFHEDWTINANFDVAQRTMDDARWTKSDHKSSPIAHCAQVS
ncbi:hypothetical protein DPMN_045377 [Dreissena polymorpha]|uniref:Uncharacterized protein n=1 Tax=Dreissena polymorpha TaxID=45954 RepID=A0A9D4D4Y8_DREPO|nr:hypothetical protein DPMN_045377 [Dreissena polymorpha]